MSRQKNKTILQAVVTILILGGTGFFIFQGSPPDGDLPGNQPAFSLGEWLGGGGPSTDDPLEAPPDGGTSEVAPLNPGNEEEDGALSQTYIDETYGFSFNYPEGYNVSNLSDENGDIILVQKPASEKGFQVFISIFDEPAEELNPARVQTDLPNMAINNPEDVLIAKGQIPALIFNSAEQILGDTREVWFVWPPEPLPNGNELYRVSAYADQDAFLGPILETWKFVE